MERNKSHLSLFVPTKLREAIEQSAAQNDRSLSAEVRCAIRAHVRPPRVCRLPSGGSIPEGAEKP